MKVTVFFCVAALLPLLLVCERAKADVVVMMNGDRLSGKVREKRGDVLRFKTGYAGTINIKWERVRELRTDEVLLTTLDDGTELRARAIEVGDGKVTITPSDGAEPVTVEKAGIAVIRHLYREPERGDDFTGRANLFARSEKGNTDSEDIGLDFDMTYRRKTHRFRLFGELETDRREAEKTRQRWMFSAAYNSFLTEKVYFTGLLKFEHDKFANLDLRTSVGPFMGYQFFESRPLNLTTEIGVVLVNEDYGTEPGNDYWGPGWHIVFNKYIYDDYLQFYHEQSGFWNARKRDKWLWVSWTGLRVPLFGGVIGSLEAKLDYDSEPAEEAERTQARYRLKLGYRW
jgi:hypothetical protein